MVNHNCNKNITLKMTGIPTKTSDIHRAMQRNIISVVKPTTCTNVSNLFYFGMTIYKFQTIFLSETCGVSFQNKIILLVLL